MIYGLASMKGVCVCERKREREREREKSEREKIGIVATDMEDSVREENMREKRHMP